MAGQSTDDAEIERQNDAIRARYGIAADWPPPAWLKGLVEPEPWWRRPAAVRLAQAAAVIFVASVSAAGGWWGAQTQTHASAANPHVAAFRSGALLERGAFTRLDPVSAVRGTAAAVSAPFLSSLLGTLQLPEQGMLPGGFRVIGAQAVTQEVTPGRPDAPQGVRFVLTSQDGERAFLYVQGRWLTPQDGLTVERRDGVSLVAWEDGPLAFGLVTGGEDEKAQSLAAAIRRALYGLPPTPIPSTAAIAGPDFPTVR